MIITCKYFITSDSLTRKINNKLERKICMMYSSPYELDMFSSLHENIFDIPQQLLQAFCVVTHKGR